MHIHAYMHAYIQTYRWDATIEGVRYVQPCLGYPTERSIRLDTVATGDFPQGADGEYPPVPLLIHQHRVASRQVSSSLVKPGQGAGQGAGKGVGEGAGGCAHGFVPRYEAGWSNFYAKYARRPELSNTVPQYLASRFKREAGGEVGWG